uniref:Protein kinase domain-containing protein n=1 Tax=Neolamprologus brichardi TaxID=32507 RepID=A0A3Q4I0P1_NEOBR
MSANPSLRSNELGIVKGSILGNHYKVEAFLGEGGFGIVAKCRDTMTNQAVAIKVNKTTATTTTNVLSAIYTHPTLNEVHLASTGLNPLFRKGAESEP